MVGGALTRCRFWFLRPRWVLSLKQAGGVLVHDADPHRSAFAP